MNATQRKYYRYLYEQRLPSAIRNDLTPVSIHQVINSKTPVKVRYPKLERYRSTGAFIYNAFHHRNFKAIRIVFNKFLPVLIRGIKEGRIPFKYNDHGFFINGMCLRGYNCKRWYDILEKELK